MFHLNTEESTMTEEINAHIADLQDKLLVLHHPLVQALAAAFDCLPSITSDRVSFRFSQYRAPEVTLSYEELLDHPSTICSSFGIETVFAESFGTVGDRQVVVEFVAWAEFPEDARETLQAIGKLRTITPEEQLQQLRPYEALTC